MVLPSVRGRIGWLKAEEEGQVESGWMGGWVDCQRVVECGDDGVGVGVGVRDGGDGGDDGGGGGGCGGAAWQPVTMCGWNHHV